MDYVFTFKVVICILLVRNLEGARDDCNTETQRCHEDADCIGAPGNFTCKCRAGYSGNGTFCYDFDECTLTNCPYCWSTGPYLGCSCLDGLTGLVDLTTSEYVRYHIGGDIAEQVCNDISSPDCVREEGEISMCVCYTPLKEMRHFCFELDECITGQHDCDENARCTNSPKGGYSCVCETGFTGDGFTCADVDECSYPIPPCPECTNTIGSYSCGCPEGYAGYPCVDIDECAEGTHKCHPMATCVNRDGGYTCTCKDGYYEEGDNGTWCSGCPNNSWTGWIDIDLGYSTRASWSPSTFISHAYSPGDFELLAIARQRYPGVVCDHPTNIEARLLNGEPYHTSGDIVHLSVDGIYCLNSEQPPDSDCHDYTVRFCCTDQPRPEDEAKSSVHPPLGNILVNVSLAVIAVFSLMIIICAASRQRSLLRMESKKAYVDVKSLSTEKLLPLPTESCEKK